MELDTLPDRPAVPGDICIRELDSENDWERVGPAMDEGYADHWGMISLPASGAASSDDEAASDDHQPQDASYSNSPGYCFIVMAGDSVVGGVFCNAKLVERDDAGRVGSMFIRPAYRRRGLGRALILKVFNAFWDHGVRHIILDTDANSLTGAPKFYTNLGMHVDRREFLYEMEIRPGKEVRRLNL